MTKLDKINNHYHKNKKAWVDEGMVWDPSEYGNTTIMPVSVDEYWTPGKRIF